VQKVYHKANLSERDDSDAFGKKQKMVNQIKNKYVWSVLCFWLLTGGGCMNVGSDAATGVKQEPISSLQQAPTDPAKAIAVTGDSFVCLKKMHPVRGFFVDNLLGNVDDTVAVAMQPEGTRYPPGSIVQLIPTEAMIKHHEGWNAQTNDWEFFELDVSAEGTRVKVRGTTQVVNKFGGNCFECHQKAAPQWDFICEQGHGCDSLPIPGFMIRWTQRNDPRCD
jgi:hypothetical protein